LLARWVVFLETEYWPTMLRTFLHSFDPPEASPVAGQTVELNVTDIDDAGIREVLQTPGAAYGAWSILDALLTFLYSLDDAFALAKRFDARNFGPELARLGR
jgi:hypothetical protein